MKTIIVAMAGVGLAAVVQAQDGARARQLFEAGLHDQALQAIREEREVSGPNAASAYLASQIHLSRNQSGEARVELERVAAAGGPVWTLIAESATALIDNDSARAVDTAGRAAMAAPHDFFAQYQLGLARSQVEDWQGAAEAFERASQLDPAFAYAHYHAGLAYSRIRRIDRTAEHFEYFLKLAPKAPERLAVESIMRTLRGR